MNFMYPTTATGFHAVSGFIGMFIGSIGVVVILVGSAKGLYGFLRRILCRDVLLADVRIELGHYLALGLEFLVAKDIIETVVQPTWSDLGKLAAIIALRTALTLFLAHEVKEVREELEEESTIRRLKRRFMRGADGESRTHTP